MHLLVVFALLLHLHQPLLDICPAFGVPTSGTGYDTETWTEYELDAVAIRAVLQLDASRSFWVGYAAGGFAWPDDVRPALTLTLTMADGGERWVDVYWSPQTPELYYMLPFADPTPQADSYGQHYGTHPCAAVLLSGAAADDAETERQRDCVPTQS